MTRLIRKKTSGTFLTREGSWTEDLRTAWPLDSSYEAHLVQRRLRLHDIELYYCYQEEQTSLWDFTIPLD